MLQSLQGLSLNQLEQGFIYDEDKKCYCCLFCEASFNDDEVYPQGEKWLRASAAIKSHIDETHGSVLEQLLEAPKKDSTLTPRQAEVLLALARGDSDSDTAGSLGISSSTLRHMRFSFRERAKQAKLFLAIYELATTTRTGQDAFIPIHKGATMVDDRYNITQLEEEKILRTFFVSQEPLKLKLLSSKEKRKIVILRRIARCFETDVHYSEPEVNEILRGIYEDFATLRRYLIEYGFMQRTPSGSEYWRVQEQ